MANSRSVLMNGSICNDDVTSPTQKVIFCVLNSHKRTVFMKKGQRTDGYSNRLNVDILYIHTVSAECNMGNSKLANGCQVSELFIHGEDGQIRERNSFGNDPRNIRG
jgi:hypothetical protein